MYQCDVGPAGHVPIVACSSVWLALVRRLCFTARRLAPYLPIPDFPFWRIVLPSLMYASDNVLLGAVSKHLKYLQYLLSSYSPERPLSSSYLSFERSIVRHSDAA